MGLYLKDQTWGWLALLPKIFVDAYVRKCDSRLLETAWIMGYRALVCEEINVPFPNKNYASNSSTTRLIRKVVIRAKDVPELRKKLGEVNYRKRFVTVQPLDIEVARWASHDSRIDSILLTTENIHVFDKKQQNTMKYYSKPLEIPLHILFRGDVELRGVIYRRMQLYAGRRVPVIISSMAEKWNELYPPISIVKLLLTQYDIPERITLNAITHIPWVIISKKEVE
ncbi:MAG: hypothetical protein QXQ71_00515 [Desulfurococcaceae archaeon]